MFLTFSRTTWPLRSATEELGPIWVEESVGELLRSKMSGLVFGSGCVSWLIGAVEVGWA
jgi:hypothetical protein